MKNNEAIRVLIVDDEAPARDKLSRYIEADGRFQLLGEAQDGCDALEKIELLSPQLLLLDIQMPGMSGFDVLRLIEGKPPAIIFTTAYDEYAVKAFELSAIDYLLKPISEERMQQALKKVIAFIGQDWEQKLQSVLQHLKSEHFIKRLAVRHLKRTSIIDVMEISYITSEHRLINIHTKDGKRYWTNENLTQLASRLDPAQFIRVHRSSMINLSAQFEIEHLDHGRLRLHFEGGNTLFVSREYSSALREQFDF